MSEERGFLDAIWNEPDEDLHRLAYADWLSESDDPARRDRGEFIRLQCQSAHMAEEDPARAEVVAGEQELLRRYHSAWTEGPFVEWLRHPRAKCANPLGHRFCELMARATAARLQRDAFPEGDPRRRRFDRVIDNTGEKIEEEFDYYPDTANAPLFEECSFSRGFIDEATAVDFVVMLFGEAPFDLAPLRAFVVDEPDLTPDGDAVAKGLIRGLKRSCLHELDIFPQIESLQTVERLANSPGLAHLEALDIFLPPDGDAAVAALAASPYLTNLKILRVSSESFGDAALAALRDSTTLRNLRVVEFDAERRSFSPPMEALYNARFRPR